VDAGILRSPRNGPAENLGLYANNGATRSRADQGQSTRPDSGPNGPKRQVRHKREKRGKSSLSGAVWSGVKCLFCNYTADLERMGSRLRDRCC